MCQNVADASCDGVADGPHHIDAAASVVGQIPAPVAFFRKGGAGVTAAHGDYDVRGVHDFVDPGLEVFAGDVDYYVGVPGSAGIGSRTALSSSGRWFLGGAEAEVLNVINGLVEQHRDVFVV